MKKLSKKIVIYIVSLVVLLSVAVGLTVAYLVSKPDPIDNSFVPVSVSCSVIDSDAGVGAKDVLVKNTGDVKAYARCVVVATWVNTTDGAIYSTAPILGIDYKLQMGSDNWILSSDGFYYYTQSVLSGSSTGTLISSVTEITVAPTGYELSISVYASMIQAEPKSAVEQTWGVTVLDNGNIYKA